MNVFAIKHFEISEGSMTNAINTYLTSCGHYKQVYDFVNRDAIDDNILIYCVGGEGVLILNDTKYKVTKGDIVYIKKNTPHCYFPCKDNLWEIYWTHFKGNTKYFDTYFNESIFNISESYELVQYFENLLLNQDTLYKELNYLTSASWINIILYFIVNRYTNAKVSDIMKSINKYLDANIYKTISLDALATEIGFSKHHICREFKKHTGETIIKHHNKMKIFKACEILYYTDVSIAQTSEKLGFSSQFYFSTVFKEVMGETPSQFKATK